MASVCSDSDYAGDKTDAKSVSGMALIIANAAADWRSKKQTNVTLSSSEAEYTAACGAVRHIVWVRRLLKQIGVVQTNPTEVRLDNQTTIKMIEDDNMTEKRRHINVAYHYTRDLLKDGAISIKWVPTADQIADIFTKALPRISFIKFREILMGRASLE